MAQTRLTTTPAPTQRPMKTRQPRPLPATPITQPLNKKKQIPPRPLLKSNNKKPEPSSSESQSQSPSSSYVTHFINSVGVVFIAVIIKIKILVVANVAAAAGAAGGAAGGGVTGATNGAQALKTAKELGDTLGIAQNSLSMGNSALISPV